MEEGCQGEALKKQVVKKGRKRRKVGERRIRKEIAQEVVDGIKEKASAHDDAKATAQRTAAQSVKHTWGCSQIEIEEEEDEDDWQKENQMEGQWAEDEKLEEILARRRMERSSLQCQVMQKVPELVLHEPMSQGEKSKVRKRKEESERTVY